VPQAFKPPSRAVPRPASGPSTVQPEAGAEPDADGSDRGLADSRASTARDRLVNEALRLFAAQGFAKTSVREIAQAAQVNVAAIRYYFGDKAGLYRAVFFEPLEASGGRRPLACEAEQLGASDGPVGSLDAPLSALFSELLAPLREGERARLCIQLHFREMLEPTGLWEEEIEHEIRPLHEALLHSLQRHFGLPEPDRELQRLALSIAGLGVHLHVASDVIDRLAPSLSVGPDTVQEWGERLVCYALGMVQAEQQRRQPAA